MPFLGSPPSPVSAVSLKKAARRENYAPPVPAADKASPPSQRCKPYSRLRCSLRKELSAPPKIPANTHPTGEAMPGRRGTLRPPRFGQLSGGKESLILPPFTTTLSPPLGLPLFLKASCYSHPSFPQGPKPAPGSLTVHPGLPVRPERLAGQQVTFLRCYWLPLVAAGLTRKQSPPLPSAQLLPPP